MKVLKNSLCLFLCLVMLSGMVFSTSLTPGNTGGSVTGGIDGADHDDMSFLSEYVQTLYDEESSIPVSQVKSSLQTHDGYMWFAGYQGLMRYDGISTKTFSPEDGFPTFNVNTLFESDDDVLWIGTNDSGLVSYDGGVFTVYGLNEGLISSSVRDIAQDDEGNVYAATAEGVVIVSVDGQVSLHPVLSSSFTTHICSVDDSRFLGLTNDGTIILFDDKRVIRTLETSDLGGFSPLSLFTSSVGTLYIGGAGNEILITDSSFSHIEKVTIRGRQTINNFFEDSMNRIWLSCDNGIGHFYGGKFTSVDGLIMSNSIEDIFEDYEGNYWVSSSRQGLLQLTKSKFTDLSFAAQLPDYIVNATAVYNGDLYIGTDDGLIVLRGNTPVDNQLTDMLSNVRIRCMLVDSKGQLWICSYERYGVILVSSDGQIVSISQADGLASNKVRCIIESDDGSMIVGTGEGLSIIRGETVVKSYGKEDGLANDVILSLCQDDDGVIYAGSDGGGIYAIDGDTVTNYTEKDGLASGVILRMAIIGEGIWISTGNSICYMDDTGIRMIEKLMAYDESVFDMIAVDEDIWFLLSNGINICPVDNLLSDEELKIRQLQRRDGLSSPITANSWNAVTDSGTIYICTGKGVLSIDTSIDGKNVSEPLIQIGGVLIDGEHVDFDDELVLPSDMRRVEIQLSLLSFASKDGTISYILEGFDNGIKTASRIETTRVSYTNLKGGDYTFRFYGTNASGVQSQETVLIIRKQYAPLEMPIIRLFLALLVIGVIVFCVWFFVSLRTKTIAKQRHEYKEVTEQALSVIASMTDSRNEYTIGHSRRVAQYAVVIGMKMGLSADELEVLRYASLLHDIGKISIPDNILNKSPVLTNDEFEIIKSHVTVGCEMLNPITVIGDISLGARYHHERIDGTGYSEGLRGDDIPVLAKIISVANAFDSMLSDRPYRKALSLKDAKSEFIHNAGTQFDEKISAIMIEMIDEGEVPI